MELYHKTLVNSNSIIKCISGCFTGSKQVEFLLLKQSSIELLAIDEERINLKLLIRSNLYSQPKAIEKLLYPGLKKDLIILTSDSGNLSILEANIQSKNFDVYNTEPYFKSGTRKNSPSEYIAIDPKGRSIMIAAIERNKLVFNTVFNNEESKIEFNSVVEANKKNNICHDLVSIDNDYNNPIFASLEDESVNNYNNYNYNINKLEYLNSNKSVILYEMDLGINNVVLKHKYSVDKSAYKLIPIKLKSTDKYNLNTYNFSINKNTKDKKLNYDLNCLIICCNGFLVVKVLNNVLHNNDNIIENNNNNNNNNSTKKENNIYTEDINYNDKIVTIPVRYDSHLAKPIVVDYAIFKIESNLVLLLITDLGDIFRLYIDNLENEILNLCLEYFDTIKPVTSICINKSGYLFAANDCCNHQLYNIQINTDTREKIIINSSIHYQDFIKEFSNLKNPLTLYEESINLVNKSTNITSKNIKFLFYNQRKLKNLIKLETYNNIGNISSIISDNCTNDNKNQLSLISGKGSRSSLKILTPGLLLKEEVSTTIKRALYIWSLPLTINKDSYDKYIIISYKEKTDVLLFGDEIKYISNSAFECSKTTLDINILQNNSYIQITKNEIIHLKTSIVNEGNNSNNESIDPINHIKEVKKIIHSSNRDIMFATSNQSQIIINILNKELVYFELNNLTQDLNKVKSEVFSFDIICMALTPVDNNYLNLNKSKYLIVGCRDNFIRVLNLNVKNTSYSLFYKMSMQEQIIYPTSISIINTYSYNNDINNSTNKDNNIKNYFLDDSNYYIIIGLANGFFNKITINNLNGSLFDSRLTDLKVPLLLTNNDNTNNTNTNNTNLNKLNNINSIKSNYTYTFRLNYETIIVVSNEFTWLCYIYNNKYYQFPVKYNYPLICASGLKSDLLSLGLLAITGDMFKVLSINALQMDCYYNIYNEVNLRYTPRKIVSHIESNCLFIIESEANSYNYSKKNELKIMINSKSNIDNANYLHLDEYDYGTPSSLNNYDNEAKITWGSCIRVIDINNNYKQTDLLELEDNQVAVSMCLADFDKNGFNYLVIGLVKNYNLVPKSFDSASIAIFSINEKSQINLVHSTLVDDIPYGLTTYDNMILVGAGNKLLLYSLGKKQLLKKCETKKLSSSVINIQVSDDYKIFVTTLSESVNVLKYNKEEEIFYLIVDDIDNKWISSSLILDNQTIAVSDKFQNFSILRIPNQADENNPEDPIGVKFKYELGKYGGAAYKFECILNFYIGEVVTSLSFINYNGISSILYGTVTGALGLFIPITKDENYAFLSKLEHKIRQDSKLFLTNRDNKMYRSSIHPIKGVIDGDLIEELRDLKSDSLKAISNELAIESSELIRRIESLN